LALTFAMKNTVGLVQFAGDDLVAQVRETRPLEVVVSVPPPEVADSQLDELSVIQNKRVAIALNSRSGDLSLKLRGRGEAVEVDRLHLELVERTKRVVDIVSGNERTTTRHRRCGYKMTTV